jgi:5'-3' exoribonuclease 2
MASDLEGLNYIINFELGTPFRPIDQLMAVLSPKSSHAIPACLRPLMEDPESPIIDFYPSDFVTDTKGKKVIFLYSLLGWERFYFPL